MSVDEGGDPPCWAHLFDEEPGCTSDAEQVVVVDVGATDTRGRSGVVWSLPHGGDLDANLVHLDPSGAIGAHVNDDVDVLVSVIAGRGSLVVDGTSFELHGDVLAMVPKGSRREVLAGAGGTHLSQHPPPTRPARHRHQARKLDTMKPDDATLARLVDAMADAVIVADADGTIIYWNTAAERVFGWPATEAVGQSLDLIIPERQRRAHWDGYTTAMATGHTRYGADLLRVPALHADGQRRSIAFTVTLLTNPDGTVSGIAAVVRDETQRWADERALRAEIAELSAAVEQAPGDG